MLSFTPLVLAALVAASPQFVQNTNLGNAGADADDSWSVGEIAETATLVVDRISEAQKFLADLNDDSFDFKQWYQEQLDDFQADQDNVAYDNAQDQADDLTDFTQQLDEISTEFAASQGEDYANFVQDIIGEGIDHLHDQAQELLNRMQETANDINDLEEQEYDLYIQLAKISCVTASGNIIQIKPEETNEVPAEGSEVGNTEDAEDEWPSVLPTLAQLTADNGATPPVSTYDSITPTTASTTPATGNSCYLKTIDEELREYTRKFVTTPSSTGKNKWRKKIQSITKKYRTYVLQWQKLFHTFTDVQQKEQHDEQEYDQYEGLLSGSQDLEEIGMQGSDKLVLDDSKITGGTGGGI